MAALTVPGVLRRPASYTGLWSWVTTVDHKRIGVLYGVTAFIYLLLGGTEAFLMRLQLARPDQSLVSPEAFNQLFTMHGTTMVFLVVMPLGAAFFNFMIPLMIGARDVAFPRLNAFSYWCFLGGSLLLNSSWFLGGAPNAGWFSYANLTSKAFNPGHGIDFWILGLMVLGVASMAAAFNFIVTIVNMRAPGMTLMRMPVFVWMTLVTSFLMILAFPVITVALIELMFDRMFGTNFFNPAAGGQPILWQHLFWLFGHPEVYILILPAMGIVSEILPTFSGKPLFGYPVVVFSGIAIGFLGWAVWSHHMFTVGLGPVANSVFALTTMTIAVPTGVKIFNWIGTLWGGSVRLTTPMLFAIGFIAMFIIGGLSGVMHAAAPSDAQQQDTYFVVAHIHYVLFGGAIFALFGGIYYWFPKVTGHLLGEGLGKLNFWLMIIGMNTAFFPMHFLGLDGMPRRIYTYSGEMGWGLWNFVSTVGVGIVILGVLVFLWNFFSSLRRGRPSGGDPWDGRTLEWSMPSPPPLYNFAAIPRVNSRDAYWEQKRGEVGDPPTNSPRSNSHNEHSSNGPIGRRPQGSYSDVAEAARLSIHLPGLSYFPILVAIGLTLAGFGLIYNLGLLFAGAALAVLSIYGWALEPVSDPAGHPLGH
ncbi:MAG: cytochrome c oxidase subunit I [Chloroflexi bacterium]|nr:cytochrome c oxidase subunit I [Chloroflexota bacterium]